MHAITDRCATAHSIVHPPVAALYAAFVAFVDMVRRWISTSEQRRGGSTAASVGPGDSRDCALIIDASGSMQLTDWQPSRIGAAKEAAKAFCQRLAREQPDARVAIIAYGTSAHVYHQLTLAADLKAIHRAVDRIGELGSTNIRAGLEQAQHVLRARCTASQIVLLSDGQNTGADPRPVADALKRFAIIDCIGIGGSPQDVDEELMKQIASEHPDGAKRYRWIGDKERLVQHFQQLAGRIRRA